MATRAVKLLTGFVIAAALLLVAALVFTLSRPAPAPPPLPNPNGYDDLVRAGRMVADNTSDYYTMSESDLRALVKTNAEALKLAKIGLGRACQVPLEYSPMGQTRVENLSVIKRLAQALAAQGRLAELENRPADAAKSYLTAIHVGLASGRGGLLIDSLVGIAIEAIGTAGMEKLVPMLDAKQCREAIAVLSSCDAQREPIDRVMERERLWARRTYGLRYQIASLMQLQSLKKADQQVAAKVKAQQARERHLAIRLAARAFELEKGRPPKTLEDLVPAYLKAIPQDRLTGSNMAYP